MLFKEEFTDKKLQDIKNIEKFFNVFLNWELSNKGNYIFNNKLFGNQTLYASIDRAYICYEKDGIKEAKQLNWYEASQFFHLVDELLFGKG